MRITEVSIRLEPSPEEEQKGKVSVILQRSHDKTWMAIPHGNPADPRGLLPYEIEIIHNFQKEVVSKFNGVGQ